MGAWKRFYSGCTPGVCRASYCSKRSLFVIFSIFPFCATGGFATNLVPKLATVKVAATTAVTPTPAFHNADIVCRRPATNLPIFFVLPHATTTFTTNKRNRNACPHTTPHGAHCSSRSRKCTWYIGHHHFRRADLPGATYYSTSFLLASVYASVVASLSNRCMLRLAGLS